MPLTKTISVVIPCYNYAHYLKECVDSVLAQSVLPEQIIIVDDLSTDDTQAVAAQIMDENKTKTVINLIIHHENKGLAGARNTGIGFAGTEYIMCLDADDMLRPDAIKEHLAIADENSIAQCGLMYFGLESHTFRPMGANLESLCRSNSVYCNSVFPKKAWEKVGGFDESDTMRLGLEDWLFWIECAAIGLHVLTNDYIALLYRRHSQTMTKQTTHPRWNEIIKYMAEKVKKKYGLETHFRPINPTA